jgi:hypothetical protein
MRGMRRIALIGLLVVAGCITTSNGVAFHSSRVEPAPPKISAVRVLFDPTPYANPMVTTYAQGITETSAEKIARGQGGSSLKAAKDASAQFVQLLSNGFKNRFPTRASTYGLSVTPDATSVLKIAITYQTTRCQTGCVTYLTLDGQLLGEGGQSRWSFKSEIGQVTTFSSISDGLFDTYADAFLAAMRSDGIIGK